MINSVYFPKSSRLPEFGDRIVECFTPSAKAIDSTTKRLGSDAVLKLLRFDLERLGFCVEKGKSGDDPIIVPVLYDPKGKVRKRFYLDARAVSEGWVLEVEAGRAVDNYQFLKDIFQACVLPDVLHLAIAVRNIYRGSHNYNSVERFLETLYVSERLQLPLKGILLIGY